MYSQGKMGQGGEKKIRCISLVGDNDRFRL